MAELYESAFGDLFFQDLVRGAASPFARLAAALLGGPIRADLPFAVRSSSRGRGSHSHAALFILLSFCMEECE